MSARMNLAAAVLTPLWKWLGSAAPPGGQRVLMYHAIGSTVPEDRQGRYSIAPARFAEQMECLAASSRRVGALGQPQADTVITFDDGYRDNLTEAYPVLKRLGLPFTIFATAGFVFAKLANTLVPGRNRVFFWGQNDEQRSWVRLSQICAEDNLHFNYPLNSRVFLFHRRSRTIPIE